MKNVRIWFEKKGAARYISHLDLTHAISRALKLSGLPVWYTEGFNPRIYMTYAMPLSLGVQGEHECMDIRLTEDRALSDMVSRLNERLPADIRALSAAEPLKKFEEIAFADYDIFLESESSAALEEKIQSLLKREQLLVMKHGKKGDKELDIKPYFEASEICRISVGTLRISFRLPCSVSGSVNPALLLDALLKYDGEEPTAKIVRKRLLIQDFSDFQ